ncbi:MAG: rod shape-determining protein MreC [Duodenibacillus sp.]|nr:rod shape-determining protein MreC [Duodenibacillus sp.]
MHRGLPPLFKQGVTAKARLIVYTLLSIILILIDSRLHILEPFRATVRTFLSPVQQVVNLPFTAFETVSNFFSGKGFVSAELDQLRRENERLLVQVEQMEELKAQNTELRQLLDLRNSRAFEETVVTEIQGEVGDQFSRHILLDQGSNIGIIPGMPVFDSTGLLGQIVRTYPTQSELLLITSKDVQVPVQFERTGLRAIAEGVGETESMRVLFVPLDSDVREGDRLVTSGIDGVFPRKTPVGIVTSVLRAKGEHYAHIEIKPTSTVGTDRFARVLLSKPAVPPFKSKNKVQGKSQHDRRGAR